MVNSLLVMRSPQFGILKGVCTLLPCSFMFSTGVVGWITQLVVDATARKRYIATQLLQTLKLHPLFCNVTTVGLVSSHPAACYALAKYACKLFYLLISSRR